MSRPLTARRLAVCAATYKRPDCLRVLLECLAAVRVPPHTSLEFRVVDNDAARSAEAVVRELAPTLPGPCRYLSEPRANISLARNAALDLGPADLVAFVDDDERVAPDWLERLLEPMERTGADATFGPVERVLPPEAPAWLARADLFRMVRPERELTWSATSSGNVLIRGEWLFAEGLRFCEDYGRSGGEDVHLFARMQQAGAKLVGAPEAVAEEDVTPQRLRWQTIARRHWRSGINYQRVCRDVGVGRHPLVSFCGRTARGLFQCARGAVRPGPRGRRGAISRGVLELVMAGGGVSAWLRPPESEDFGDYDSIEQGAAG